MSGPGREEPFTAKTRLTAMAALPSNSPSFMTRISASILFNRNSDILMMNGGRYTFSDGTSAITI